MTSHRVLIVDDSRTTRALLRQILSADEDITVVGEAADGAEAVELTKRLRPSLVVMDINMPGMDGWEATKRIMIEQPTPILIVTAGYDAGQVEVSLKAVGAGALTVMPKPAGPGSPRFAAEAKRLTTLVKALGEVKVVRQRRSGVHDDTRAPSMLTEPVDSRRLSARSIEAVGVAASTGGPAALYRFLELLPRTLDVPVLVVQHIAVGFVEGLARWLATASLLPVSVAVHGAPALGGEVFLAPDDRHLALRDGFLELSSAPRVGGFRPSANVLFCSLAEAHGPAAAAVVLTGMGDDGLTGASQVAATGGLVLAQDADSSAVFGMPAAVVRAGIADAVGAVDDLSYRVARYALKRGS